VVDISKTHYWTLKLILPSQINQLRGVW
jgi:hypothetical protein